MVTITVERECNSIYCDCDYNAIVSIYCMDLTTIQWKHCNGLPLQRAV
jgi:hypothetical protein